MPNPSLSQVFKLIWNIKMLPKMSRMSLRTIENINKNKNLELINYYWRVNLIQLMRLSTEELNFYEKLKFLASIPSSTHVDTKNFTSHDLFEVCQYTEPYLISNEKQNLLNRLKQFKNTINGDSCLHIAAKASNYKLAQFLVDKKIIDPNIENYRKENPLMSTLIYNQDPYSERIAYMLAKYTDLSARDIQNNQAHEVHQYRIDPNRARLIEYLKKASVGK